MKNGLMGLNLFFEGLPDLVRTYRLVFWGIFLLLTFFFFFFFGRIVSDVSMQGFFKDDEQVKIAYDRFRAIFGSDEAVYLVYEAKDGDVFSRNSLLAIKGIQDELL